MSQGKMAKVYRRGWKIYPAVKFSQHLLKFGGWFVIEKLQKNIKVDVFKTQFKNLQQ